jgi:DNA primase
MVEAAIPVVDYYFQIVTKDLDLDEAKGKSAAVRSLVPILSEIRDEVERTHYVQKLARLARVDEGAIRRQLIARARPSPKGKAEMTDAPAPGVFGLEEHCLAVLMRRPEALGRINSLFESLSLLPLQADDFGRIENRTLFSSWSQFGEEQDWQEWVNNLPLELQHHLDFLLSHGLDSDELVGKDAERDIERRAVELRLKSVGRANQNLRMLQIEALEQGDAKATEFGHMMVALTRNRFRLESALSERTALAQREREQAS